MKFHHGEGEGGLTMFANRLKKNKKEVFKKAKVNQVTCFRLYDKDVPQVPVAIDHYLEEGTGRSYFVLNYFRGPYDGEPGDDSFMDKRIGSIVTIIEEILGIKEDQLYTKLREKKKGKSQYNKLSQIGKAIIVREKTALLKVNLSDYLDTGLFLDHRPLRLQIRDIAQGKSLLNLFCYTGVFSLQAAIGGASRTVNVDLSSTYLDWGIENLKLNGIDTSCHSFIESDVWDWVEKYHVNKPDRFDIILLDPPTFSNTKKKNQLWDLQAHHAELISLLMEKFLAPGGVLYFSCNFRKFRIEEDKIPGVIQDISESTIPFDFRDSKIHRTYEIRNNYFSP